MAVKKTNAQDRKDSTVRPSRFYTAWYRESVSQGSTACLALKGQSLVCDSLFRDLPPNGEERGPHERQATTVDRESTTSGESPVGCTPGRRARPARPRSRRNPTQAKTVPAQTR